MAFDTFDTDASATAGITFTNGNLTAQGASGTSIRVASIVQALEGKTSGKWYVEFTCVAVSGGVDGVGVLNSWGLAQYSSTGGYIGSDVFYAPSGIVGTGYYTNGNVVRNNGAITSVNATTFTTGDVIGMAIDLDNSRIWYRKNTGSWIGVSGTPNPATNTNGFDLSGILTLGCRVYPAVNISGSSGKFTANFGATSFTGAVPSGFTSGWTNTGATYFGTFASVSQVETTVSSPGTDLKCVSPYVANASMAVASVVIPFANFSATAKGVIYDATGVGGLPGALLGVSTNTITSTSAGEKAFTFSGVNVTNGSTYWVGFILSSGSVIFFGVNQTNGFAYNTGSYASPTNPFGASPTTGNYRMPAIINLANVSPSATATMSFAGISFVSAATDSHTNAATLTFAGIAFDSATTAALSSEGVLTFRGIAFTGATTVSHNTTAVMHFGGISIDAATLDYPSPGAGRRSFWTFGA